AACPAPDVRRRRSTSPRRSPAEGPPEHRTRLPRMSRRVTFSRNLTLSLSRSCQCYCKYCAFSTHQAHLQTPDEVERLLDQAARRNVKELLVLTGERPEVNRVVAEQLRRWGHEDFTSYVVW